MFYIFDRRIFFFWGWRRGSCEKFFVLLYIKCEKALLRHKLLPRLKLLACCEAVSLEGRFFFCFSTWKIPPFTILAYLSLLFKLCAFIHLCVCMDKSDNYFLHTHFGGNYWLFRLFDDLCSVENLQFTKDVFQTRNILATTITAIDYICLIFLMFLWLIGYFACSLVK